MRKDILNYLKVAAKMAVRKQDRRSFFLGSVGVRSDGVHVYACNGPTRYPCRRAHSEYKVAQKMDYGGVVYTARIMHSTGEFVNARPCDSCVAKMKSKKIKRCYYTISDSEYGMIDLDKWHESNYTIKKNTKGRKGDHKC